MFVGEAGTRLRDPLQHGNAGRWYEQRLSLLYPLRPRKRRSRPPILWGQLIKTKEQKIRFLRTKFMSLCSYVKNKYVFMYLCLKQKEICHFVLMSKCKDKRTEEQIFKNKFMPLCSYV